jgi:hypothetical protein
MGTEGEIGAVLSLGIESGPDFHTYVELYPIIRMYKFRCAERQHYSTTMWKEIRTAAGAIAVIVIWFTVVTLGLASQMWPLLASVR